MCSVLKVSRSGYYDWRKRVVSQRAQANELLLCEIRKAYELNRGLYGSPRITEELHSLGISCNRKRVAKLMRNHGIRAKTKRKFKITTDSTHRLPVAANIVNQHFVAERPNQLWTSDITYLWTREGWMYLSVILDVCSRQIVGYSMNNRLTTDIVTDAFKRAVGWRKVEPGMIFHSDRGSQYASTEMQRLLASYGIRPSMSSTGNCYDNAITETFFHTLKTELIYFNRYETRKEASNSIFEYIEVFYNRRRRHSAIGYHSPVQFELINFMS
jgi:transposase InsO family protein